MLGSLVPLSALSHSSPLEYVGGTVLASAASSITIPVRPSYRVLVVECYIIKDGTQAAVYFRINGDSGANYDWQHITANSTTVSGARTTGDNEWFPVNTQITANDEAHFAAIIAKSTPGTNAQALFQSDITQTNIFLELHGAQWNNTADGITSVGVFSNSGNLAADTTVAVYGLRG